MKCSFNNFEQTLIFEVWTWTVSVWVWIGPVENDRNCCCSSWWKKFSRPTQMPTQDPQSRRYVFRSRNIWQSGWHCLSRSQEPIPGWNGRNQRTLDWIGFWLCFFFALCQLWRLKSSNNFIHSMIWCCQSFCFRLLSLVG